jgi:hypothetical protein
VADEKPQIPVGSAKAATHGTYGPATWVNVMYYDIDAGSSTPGEVIAAVAEAQHDFYHDAIGLGYFPTTWHTTWTTVSYRDASDSLVRLRVADAQAGSEAGVFQDAQVAYLVNWGTGDPRRGGKPRQYLTGVWDGALADSAFLTSGAMAAVNASIITWLEDLPTRAIPLQLVEMSFRNDKTWRDAAHTYPIIGGTLNPVVATQRRRVDRLRPS